MGAPPGTHRCDHAHCSPHPETHRQTGRGETQRLTGSKGRFSECSACFLSLEQWQGNGSPSTRGAEQMNENKGPCPKWYWGLNRDEIQSHWLVAPKALPWSQPTLGGCTISIISRQHFPSYQISHPTAFYFRKLSLWPASTLSKSLSFTNLWAHDRRTWTFSELYTPVPRWRSRFWPLHCYKHNSHRNFPSNDITGFSIQSTHIFGRGRWPEVKINAGKLHIALWKVWTQHILGPHLLLRCHHTISMAL